MSKMIPVVELFGNTIQGEGALVGTPAIFVRVFGCNLCCAGFGMPAGELSHEADDIVKSEQFKNAKTIKDLPLAKTGCDSYPAIHPACMRFCKMFDISGLVEAIKEIAGDNKPLVVFTGGEPLLRQHELACVIEALYRQYHFKDCMFETNGTVAWQEFWVNECPGVNLWFSISPKLSTSGNAKLAAIKPVAVASLVKQQPKRTYLKFVVDKTTPLDELQNVVAEFNELCDVNDLPHPDVYLMPEGGVLDDRSRENAQYVADLCWKLGYRFSPREHLTVYGNAWAK